MHAGEQPHGGARIAAVERFRRRAQAHADSRAVERVAIRREVAHPDTAGAKARRGRRHVLRRRRVADVAPPSRQRAEDQRAMADRLVAGDGDHAVDSRCGTDALRRSPRACHRRAHHRTQEAVGGEPRRCPESAAMLSRSADPTTAASAWPRRAARCALVDRPNPSARGTGVTAAHRFEQQRWRRPRSSRRAPVTPVTPTQYTKPAALEQMRARRSGVVVGATSGTSGDPAPMHRSADVRCLVERKVRNDEAVDARRRCRVRERRDAEGEHRVDVRHHRDRDGQPVRGAPRVPA